MGKPPRASCTKSPRPAPAAPARGARPQPAPGLLRARNALADPTAPLCLLGEEQSTLLQQKAGEGQACGGNEEMRCFPPNPIPLVFVGLPADSAFICLHLSMENERKLGSLPRLSASHGLHPTSSSNLGAGSSQGHPDTGHCSDRGHPSQAHTQAQTQCL